MNLVEDIAITMESQGVETPLTRMAVRDMLFGLDNSGKMETTEQVIAYRIGQIRGTRIMADNDKIARRSRSTWSKKANARNR